MNALYYCHVCGLRLKAEEVDVAVARGESHATACCEKCAKQGKRIKDPRSVEASSGSATHKAPQHNAGNPIPSSSAILAAQGDDAVRPRSLTPPQGSRNTPPRASRPESAAVSGRAARNTPAGGVQRPEPGRAARGTPSGSVRLETAQLSRAPRRGSAALPAERKGERDRTAKKSELPLVPILGGVGAVMMLIAVYLVAHSGGETTSEPDSKIVSTTIKPPAGGTTDPAPPKPAESNTNAASNGAAERKQAEFERNLPPSLGVAPRGTVLYGPTGANEKVSWNEGKESLRAPDGKPPYLDGTHKLTFALNGAAGMVTHDAIVIEYSAAYDVDVAVWIDLPEFGHRGGTLRFPAGSMQKVELYPDDEKILTRGKHGKALGRTINALGIEPKGVQPGTFGIFRISR